MVRDGNSRASWNDRPRPRAARSCGASSVMSSPRRRTRPPSIGEEAGDAVEQRGLAGAVVADEAEDLALAELEVDVVDRGDAAEALHHAVALEDLGASGPGARDGAASATAARPCGAGPWPAPSSPASALRRRRPAMNTERRMSGRSSRSAVEPGEAHLALLHEHGPLGELRATLIDCSTITIVVPGAWIAVHDVEQLPDDRSGARPSDSSSIMSSSGRG